MGLRLIMNMVMVLVMVRNVNSCVKLGPIYMLCTSLYMLWMYVSMLCMYECMPTVVIIYGCKYVYYVSIVCYICD